MAAEYSTPESSEADATRSEVIHEWAGGTSIHGVEYVFDLNARAWKRALFILLFCTCLGLLTWNLTVVIQNYLDYSTTTSIQTIAPQSLTFPDVTVCNVNPFQASKVNATGITSPVNDEELNLITQQLDEFVVFTEFDGEDLNAADYWKQTITDAGPCWTFHTDTKVTRPGLTSGLVFSVFIHRDDYYDGAETEGVFIYVTEPNTTSITIDRPFTDLGPGFAHTVFLDVTKYDREEQKPWSTCVKTPETFSQPACRADCYFDYHLEQCGCRALGDNRPKSLSFVYCASEFEVGDDDDDDYGSSATEAPDECSAGLFEDLECDCPDPPCKETVYSTRTSGLQLSQFLLNDLAGIINSTEDFVRQNLLVVQMNFEAIRREEVTETKAVSFSGLLAAIGGLLGFFLGISVFSFAEVFDLCFLRLLPRSWGDRRLYGVGGTVDRGEAATASDSGDSHQKTTSLGSPGTDIDDMRNGGDKGVPTNSQFNSQSPA